MTQADFFAQVTKAVLGLNKPANIDTDDAIYLSSISARRRNAHSAVGGSTCLETHGAGLDRVLVIEARSLFYRRARRTQNSVGQVEDKESENGGFVGWLRHRGHACAQDKHIM